MVVGDIHGQFDTTLTIFEQFGYPSKKVKYLFNGDIVDRGDKSLECILMIFAFKIALPDYFFVNRGNHETRRVRKQNFYNDCMSKLSEFARAFDDFHAAFDCLPYGSIVQMRIFVTHGGLCPGIELSKLGVLMRPHFNHKNVFEFYYMLWNDPCDDCEPVDKNYLAPNPRGKHCYKFHPLITYDFLNRHKLKLLVRSHEVVADGALYSQNDMCLTIFSAPNYRDSGNRGAVLIVYQDRYEVHQMSE